MRNPASNMKAIFDLTDSSTLRRARNGPPCGHVEARNRWRPVGLLAGAILILGISAASAQPIVYVRQAATGANNGSSWADAFTDLTDALAAAATPGSPVEQVWVAEATYRPDRGTGDRTLSFVVPSGVGLFGGFAGGETSADERDWQAHPTILSGAVGPDMMFPYSCHVVRMIDADESTIVDGFIIERGRAQRGVCPPGSLGGHGGGMLLQDSSPRVRNCIIRDNETDYDSGGPGGGVASIGVQGPNDVSTGHPHFVNCSITGNSTGGDELGVTTLKGAGIYAASVTLVNCLVADNNAGWGVFFENHNGDWGGGIYGIDVTLINCRIADNNAGWGIGGMWKGGTGGSGGSGGGVAATNLIAVNCVFDHNFAGSGAQPAGRGGDGGAVYVSRSITATNCLFYGNRAGRGANGPESIGRGGNGGAVWAAGGAADRSTFANCTFAANTAGPTAAGGPVGMFGAIGGVATTMSNSVVWNNGTTPMGPDSPNNYVAYSLVQGGHAGVGNVDADPLFLDQSMSDFHLSPGSPAINTGDASGVFPGDAVDLDGRLRVQCGQVDMGAYETGTNHYGDVNCDDSVSLFDYAFWDACRTGPDAGPYYQGCQPFDFDGDGDVDLVDFGSWQQAFSGG